MKNPISVFGQWLGEGMDRKQNILSLFFFIVQVQTEKQQKYLLAKVYGKSEDSLT